MIPVAILAGGLATRLRPVTETIPKSLLEVAGQPFIFHQLALLQRRGLRRVVLCIGHLGELIQDYVGTGSRWGLQVDYSSDRDRLLGTGGAIKQALPKLGERFFVLYGDSYLDDDFGMIDRAHLASNRLGLMTVLRNQDQWDKSNVVYRDGEIICYDKTRQTADMHYIDWGLGVLRPDAFAEFPAYEPFDLAAAYRKLLEAHQLAGLEVKQRFFEIGSAQGLRETAAYIAAEHGQ